MKNSSVFFSVFLDQLIMDNLEELKRSLNKAIE
jgi:hypothetical protein